MIDFPIPDLSRPVDDIARERAAMFAAQSGLLVEKLPAAESHPDPPLHSFPLRTDWEQARLREAYPDGTPYRYKKGSEEYEEIYAQLLDPAAPFPAPVVTSRQENAFLAPKPVLQLAEFARERSWEVRGQYSQGNVPHGTTGKPSVLKDVVALRFGAHPLTERQAYACYVRNASGGTWSWDGIMVWGPDLPPYAGCGLVELRQYLDRPADQLGQWVDNIKRARANQERERKAKVKAAPRKSSSDEAS